MSFHMTKTWILHFIWNCKIINMIFILFCFDDLNMPKNLWKQKSMDQMISKKKFQLKTKEPKPYFKLRKIIKSHFDLFSKYYRKFNSLSKTSRRLKENPDTNKLSLDLIYKLKDKKPHSRGNPEIKTKTRTSVKR